MATLFNQLNYTLGNEDNSLELRIVPDNLTHAMCAAGSGVSPMVTLSRGPKMLSCVDISERQLYFTELRIESARKLRYEDFLSFWAYPGYQCDAESRKSFFNSLSLTPPSRLFLELLFNKNKWESILYYGRFERFFSLYSAFFRFFIGAKWKEIFLLNTIEEQQAYFATRFPKKRLNLSIFLHAGIYKLSLQLSRDLVKANIDQSFYQFFTTIFYHLLQNFPVRRNLLLQLFFYGKPKYLEACPPECNRKIFNQIKEAINSCDIRYINDDIISAATKSPEKIDFINFSNIPSFFSGSIEKNYLQLIRNNLTQKGMVLNRYHLHIPENPDTVGYKNITRNYIDFIKKESTQLYEIELFERL